jgi:hypothetical protein
VRGDAEKAKARLEAAIVQLLPCTTPLYNVYSNNDGTFYQERVDYLALCADGEVRSLAKPDVVFMLAAEASNFEGCFEEHRLIDFLKSGGSNTNN